jgi:Ca2+-binding EF-hand superfamily protein
MNMLGLNPAEWEVVQLLQEYEEDRHIFFPNFCRIVSEKMRNENEEETVRSIFKAIKGKDVFHPVN